MVATSKIPVSVVVVTKNEEARIGRCLSRLKDFDDVWVVDSHSSDRTCEIAEAYGARVHNFSWDLQYPKKRQWCLDRLALKYDHVFFVDADEEVSQDLVREIAALDWRCAGYFVAAKYRFDGRILRFGLQNNKLVLFDRRVIEFPAVDDLDIAGMGEIEGHYQPVFKPHFQDERLGQLEHFMVHDAYDDREDWHARHQKYARWEAGMNMRGAWPHDPHSVRAVAKTIFRALPFRGSIAFLHSAVLRLGFLDGLAGLRFAWSRLRYYRMISAASKVQEIHAAAAMTRSEAS